MDKINLQAPIGTMFSLTIPDASSITTDNLGGSTYAGYYWPYWEPYNNYYHTCYHTFTTSDRFETAFKLARKLMEKKMVKPMNTIEDFFKLMDCIVEVL